MRLITRMIPNDPVVIWEQYYQGLWARFTLDMHENVLDIATFDGNMWTHAETIYLIGQ